ncbi:MAG TPA: hypothetical protein VIK16_04585 [Candidatus Limnocylindrales bacterium]
MSGERDTASGTSRPAATPCPPQPPPAFLANRFSAHLHNHLPDHVALADALRGLRVPFEA